MKGNLILDFLNGSFIATILGGVITIAAVFVKSKYESLNIKKENIELSRKIFEDILSDTENGLEKIKNIASYSGVLSDSSLSDIIDAIEDFKDNKKLIYNIDDGELRNDIRTTFKKVEDIVKLGKVISSQSGVFSTGVNDSFIDKVKNTKKEIGKIKVKVKKI
nr:MAG TPA: hypothetical protein [Caudoviricetes sp.]